MKGSINEVEVNNTETGLIVGNPKFEFGANYVFLYLEHGGDLAPEFKKHSITPANEVHMFFIVPQYFVMTCGEVMFSITGLEFAFSQVSLPTKLLCRSLLFCFGQLTRHCARLRIS